MKNDFKEVCESVNKTLRQTKMYRYPRQIQLSEDFTKALEAEVSRHMQILDEGQRPINNFPEKFLKALKFELKEISDNLPKRD